MNKESSIKLLLASRAAESPLTEGGFVLLSDLAKSLVHQNLIETSVFSLIDEHMNKPNKVKAFSSIGWRNISKFQYPIGIYNHSGKYDVVHTAHIPTVKNSIILKAVTRRARKNGVKFIQTITGLPNLDDKNLHELLWGDFVVCQTSSAYKRVSLLTKKHVSLITPWPSPQRVAFDEIRKKNTRLKLNVDGRMVLFPGEFERMGIGLDFADCLAHIFKNDPCCKVYLACRFDNLGVGKRLAKMFPCNVVNVGETNNIIELLEASDLTIFPTRKMENKFHPPLIIMESLSLGTPTLISDLIDIDKNVSTLLKIIPSSDGWFGFADKILEASEERTDVKKIINNNNFTQMFKAYRSLYLKAGK
ncbi:MAG: hypothetical protein JJU29_02790 [Verrucomicrobia bacterium]|nr:hypothetical protein [Verrucomicrobiota bacterium]MCH8511421.1 hypothetical protein [Kiritimatiellia bacterium]